jgi:hypothetical protein
MSEPVWHIHELNCHDSHVLDVYYNGGLLQYGWAKDPSGHRSQHVWILRNAKRVDLFNWTDHEPLGFRDMPPYKSIKPLLVYLRDNHIEW